MWFKCIGVVSGGCYKEVYRYPHNNYFFSLLHLYYLFLAAASLLVCSFLKYFFFFVYVIFVQYSKRYSKNIRDHSKTRITGI